MSEAAPIDQAQPWEMRNQERMRQFGKVDVPQEAFIPALKVDV